MLDTSLHDIKRELASRSTRDLLDICLKLGRYKKENKELLSFLLFEQDEDQFLDSAKIEITAGFSLLPSSLPLAKKVLRKILKSLVKYCRFAGSKKVETELRMHFCLELQDSGINLKRYPVIANLYIQQLKLISKSMATLHEDLQFDLTENWEKISAAYSI